MTQTRAVAHPNLALVKYWGKKSVESNIPATPSLSITLGGLCTTTTVAEHRRDRFVLNDVEQRDDKVAAWLELLRRDHAIPPLSIESTSNFPPSCGLASSASGFAALTLALNEHLNWKLDELELANVARQGSVSAARSILGGFVALEPSRDDCSTKSLFPSDHWDLRIVVAITDSRKKSISSREGMQRSVLTSPYYESWVHGAATDFKDCEEAIGCRDLAALGYVTEKSCRKMHALMLTSEPALIYWNSGSLEVIDAVHNLRREGTIAFYTSDAGPQIKIICEPEAEHAVRSRIEALVGVQQVLVSSIGEGAQVLADD